MGIIQQAVLADRSIRNKKELLEREMETLRTVYEHRAISEAEYNRSLAVLKKQMPADTVPERREKLSDIIGNYRNNGSAISA